MILQSNIAQKSTVDRLCSLPTLQAQVLWLHNEKPRAHSPRLVHECQITDAECLSPTHSSFVGPTQIIHSLKKLTTCCFVSLLAFSAYVTLLLATVSPDIVST